MAVACPVSESRVRLEANRQTAGRYPEAQIETVERILNSIAAAPLHAVEVVGHFSAAWSRRSRWKMGLAKVFF
jgi:N-acetyl-anhydromuramyl-L-alanine amidase AmpD